MTLSVKIVEFGKFKDSILNGIIYVFRELSIDKGIKFLCPCGCNLELWIPLGDDNNEDGSYEPRQLHWIKQDEILSITPSIEIKGGCKSHFYITENTIK